MNSFAEFYMQIFGKYEKSYVEACKAFCEERKRFMADLQKIDFLEVYPSQANYFLCKVTKKYSSTELTQLLLKYNVLIKDCSTKAAFNGKNYIRLAIRNKRDNQTLYKHLLKLEGNNL